MDTYNLYNTFKTLINMQKIIIIITIALLFETAAMAQNRILAVFEPSGVLGDYMKELVHDEVVSAFGSVRDFTLLERHMVDLTLQENMSRPGSDAQIIEMGRIMGADFVLLTSVERAGSNFSISFRLLEMRTERTLRQRTVQTRQGLHDMTETIQRTLSEMFATTVTSTTVLPQGMLFSKKKTVYQLNHETIEDQIKKDMQENRLKTLSRNEVQTLMADTDALDIYNEGFRQNRGGNVFLFGGIAAIVGSLILDQALPSEVEVRREFTGTQGNKYYTYEMERRENTISPILAVTGSVSVIIGFIMKSGSNSIISRSVNSYNSSKTFSNTELNFDFTGNGARLTLKF